MHFGLRNAPVTFGRLRKNGKTFEEYLTNLKDLFIRNSPYSLTWHILATLSHYMEFIYSVKQWSVPNYTTEVRGFVGLCSYYRRIIEKLADIAQPLHSLIESDCRFVWTSKLFNSKASWIGGSLYCSTLIRVTLELKKFCHWK